MLHEEDCFVRLPCKEDLYENQDIPDTPYLAMVEQKLTWQEKASLGNMAYLIAMASAWGDALRYLYRLKYRVVSAEGSTYEGYYREKQRQMTAFIDRLPPHLFPCNRQNFERALQGGYIEIFISLHELYHTTLMKVNRHVEHAQLEEESVKRNVRAAQYHAREVLAISRTLSELYRTSRSWRSAWVCSTPFQGYAILSAVDILTSVGTLADVKSDLELVQGSLEVVRELSNYWASAQKQQEMIVFRFREIMRALDFGSREPNTVFITRDPLEDAVGKELDVFFSTPLERRLKALGLAAPIKNGIGVLIVENLELITKATNQLGTR